MEVAQELQLLDRIAPREALGASPDWGYVLVRAGLLSAVAALLLWFAVRAFRSYQASV